MSVDSRLPLVVALQTEDADAVEYIGASQQQLTPATAAKPWEFDMSGWADDEVLQVVKHVCDIRLPSAKTLKNSAWKILHGLAKCPKASAALQTKCATFIVEQSKHALDSVAAKLAAKDQRRGGEGDAANNETSDFVAAKFVTIQLASLAKAIPQVCRQVIFGDETLRDGAPLPVLLDLYASCAQMLSLIRRPGASPLFTVEREILGIMARLDAAVTAMASPETGCGSLMQDLRRVMMSAAGWCRSVKRRDDDAFDASLEAQGRATVASGSFAIMVACCRADDAPTMILIEAFLMWLPYLDSVSDITLKNDLAAAVAHTAKHLPATHFVEAPTYAAVTTASISDVGAGHRWWLVMTKCLLGLPLTDSLPLLTMAMACPDDTSLERIGALWLTLLHFAKDSPAHSGALAAALISLAGCSDAHPMAQRAAAFAARLLHHAGNRGLIVLSDSALTQLPPAAASHRVNPKSEHWSMLASATRWHLSSWASSTCVTRCVVDHALAQAASQPVAAARVVAVAARQGTVVDAVMMEKALRHCLATCTSSLVDGCVAATCDLLAGISHASLPPALEAQLTVPLRSAVEAVFSSIRPSLLAHATQVFAQWAERTPVDVGDGFLSADSVAELLRHFLEVRSLVQPAALPHSTYAPPVAATAAAHPVHLMNQTAKKHRTENTEIAHRTAAPSNGDLFPRTQSSDDGGKTAAAKPSCGDAALSPEVVPPLRRALQDACAALGVASAQLTNVTSVDDATRAVARDVMKRASALLARMESHAISIDSD